MSFSEGNGSMSAADMAAVLGNNRGYNGFFGGDGAWWLIVLLLFANNGWGNGFGGGGMMPYLGGESGDGLSSFLKGVNEPCTNYT